MVSAHRLLTISLLLKCYAWQTLTNERETGNKSGKKEGRKKKKVITHSQVSKGPSQPQQHNNEKNMQKLTGLENRARYLCEEEKEIDGGEQRIGEQRKSWMVLGYGSSSSRDSVVLLHLEARVTKK